MIYIITVNYNQNKYIEWLIDNLDKDISRLVVVDNSEKISNFNCYKYIKTSNVGYLKGLIMGVNSIDLNRGEKIVLCNPDIEISNETIKYIECYDMNKYDLIAPDIRTKSGDIKQNPNMSKKPNILRKTLFRVEFFSFPIYYTLYIIKSVLRNIKQFKAKKIINNDKVHEIFLPHGSFMIFKSDFFMDIDNSYENIFLWGEEAIFAAKVREAGGKVLYEPKIKVIHDEHSSTKNVSVKERYITWKKSYNKYKKYL